MKKICPEQKPKEQFNNVMFCDPRAAYEGIGNEEQRHFIR